MELLSLERILIDGLLFSLAFAVIVVGSLAYNARLWIQDYPAEIRALQAPLTLGEKREKAVLGAAFMVMLIGGFLLSGLGVEAANGGSAPFLTVFLHLWLVFNIVNLFDAVVLDWFMFLVLKPSFVYLPGSEAHMDAYRDPTMHIANYFKGVLIGAVISAIMAGIVVIL